jgi:hypothetical protein
LALGDVLALGDLPGDGELDGVDGGALEEGDGEGTGVPEAELLVADTTTSTGGTGGVAAASATPATIARRPATMPAPSSTVPQEEP